MPEQISVLVIDDDRMVRMLVESTLSQRGFDVYMAENGPSGLGIAQKEDIDVILLDWMMPDMDGMEVFRQLKHNEKTRNIPVFMFTTKEGGRDVDQAVSLGVDDYIVKPFNASQMHTMIRDRLKKISDADDDKKKSFFARLFSKSS